MDNQQSYKLAVAAAHHVESFNFIYEQGLAKILHYLQPMELHEKDLSPENHTKQKYIQYSLQIH
jgi:hypothetical protein